ncbi:hypothetical protein [Rudanella paleaurantiibacter]|nr:hypothetical protein [Rudanella paleaurantiibacter]
MTAYRWVIRDNLPNLCHSQANSLGFENLCSQNADTRCTETVNQVTEEL